MSVRPIFLFSLPRSGSTLVQRVLASHPAVATTSEPWILLPQLYALRSEGTRAEYWHGATGEAIEDFCAELPNGVDDYLASVREFAMSLYTKASEPSSRYFLDKTPHYHLVAEQIITLFPDAKFVFLWRNPLSVLASFLETFRLGRWEPYDFRVHLDDGIANLAEAWRQNEAAAFAVRYEDLVSGGEPSWRALFEYLELEFEPALLTQFPQVELRGRYGDPTGTLRYSGLSGESVDRWRETIRTPVRKAWCRRYLERIGPGDLAAMGYDLGELLRDVDDVEASPQGAATDLYRMSASFAYHTVSTGTLRVPETRVPIGPAFRPVPTYKRRLISALRRRAGHQLRRSRTKQN